MDARSARLGQKVILQPFMSCTLMPVDNIRNIRLRPLLGVNLDSKFDLNIFRFCVQVDEIQPVMMLLNLVFPCRTDAFGIILPYRQTRTLVDIQELPMHPPLQSLNLLVHIFLDLLVRNGGGVPNGPGYLLNKENQKEL